MSETVAAQSVEKPDFSNPEKECDLVMKGGVTSGIIYPPAILKLATQYRFRNIGGTSAGAIAAAATAAAEYGRANGQADRAFATLQNINEQLGSCLIPDPNNNQKCQVTFLQNLFQPTAATKPLFDIGLTLLTEKPQSASQKQPLILSRLSWLNAIFRAKLPVIFNQGSQQGLLMALFIALLLTGISFFAFSLFDGQPSPAGLLVLLLLYGLPLAAIGRRLGGWSATLQQLWKILTEEVIAKNGFGLCTGKAGIPSARSGKALIEWLHEDVINKLADKPLDQPLTFGDLRNLKDKDKSIILNMVTSNLSHNRPYLLPFQEKIFIFHEGEFLRLFPKEVVDYLKSAAPTRNISFDDNSYHFLPIGDAMPVLVATRMSLSFPLLFSAIPLYTIPTSSQDQNFIKTKDLQRNWFSDGGISSNFPIHFFDAWLPSRPTFGINLTTWQEQDGNLGDAPRSSQFSGVPTETHKSTPLDERVSLPKADDAPYPFWQNLDNKLLKFLGAIFATSQNYRDTMQSTLPSYRERIVQIRLKDSEGGLNLNMPPRIIEFLKEQGVNAGQKLLKDFQFEHHQWVRLKVMVGLLETQLKTVANASRQTNLNYQELLKHQQDASLDFPFPESDQGWLNDALGRLKELEDLIRQWQERDHILVETQQKQQSVPQKGFAQQPPLTKEKPILRVTPDL